MLKNELTRRVAAYNNQLASISFQMPDIGGVSGPIKDLKSHWDTNGSVEVTDYLTKMCTQLETQLDQLNTDVNKLKTKTISFDFSEKEIEG